MRVHTVHTAGDDVAHDRQRLAPHGQRLDPRREERRRRPTSSARRSTSTPTAARSAPSATTSRSTRRVGSPFAVHQGELRRHAIDGFSDPGLAADATTTSASRRPRTSTSPRPTRYLRLVLAHAVNGDIRHHRPRVGRRIDEDLYLVKNGTARFAESNTRAPSGDDLDAPRSVPERADLRRGRQGHAPGRRRRHDRTRTAEILADGSIDIFGDYGNARPGAATART